MSGNIQNAECGCIVYQCMTCEKIQIEMLCHMSLKKVRKTIMKGEMVQTANLAAVTHFKVQYHPPKNEKIQ